VPELPEVERLRRSLEPAMSGARFERVILNRRDLRQPFPADFARRLRRQTVRALSRRGKYLLAELSSGDTLLMHLGMSGWFRIEPTSRPARRPRDRDADLERRHDHVIFTMSSGMTVTFNDPRRFGLMDLLTAEARPPHASLGRMGPEPLSRAFHAKALAAGCARRKIALKVALLDQRIVAGDRQHLRERGAPPGGIVAVPDGIDDRGRGGRTESRRRASRRRDQVRAAARHRVERDRPRS
jgi:formamidopyrimidine-DNA glycosylase